jgi:hypothetical protein
MSPSEDPPQSTPFSSLDMLAEFTTNRRTADSLARVSFLPSAEELRLQDVKEDTYLSDYVGRVKAAREKNLGGRTSGTAEGKKDTRAKESAVRRFVVNSASI